MNNEELNVGACLVYAQKIKHKNNATSVGESIARPFRKNQGITLIALIITIIVMLILAGVVLNLTIGERGIFKTAQNAAKNYTNASEKELAELDEFDNNISDILNGLGQTGGNTETGKTDGSFSTKNKVNTPKLNGTGLIPVTIDSYGITTTANTQNDDWYSYDGQANNWANAITKDGSMWVWIPRYAYKITYTNESAGGTIDVVFLQGTTNKDFNGNDVTSSTYVDEKGSTGAYIVHPAFQDGSEKGLNNWYKNGEWNSEIPGFWMAKFEAGYVGTAGDASTAVDSTISYSTIHYWNGSSAEDLASNYYGIREVGTKIKYPTFQANRPIMNNIAISDAYDLCMSLKNASDVYGLSNIDSHMVKNSEWGAVAYLTQSKYGRNGVGVTVNNVRLDNVNTVYSVTGYGGETINASLVHAILSEIENGTLEGNWTTMQGQASSSTGNIYGIYGLSGGGREWTAGYIIGLENYEKYGGSLRGESNQYKTKYAGTSSSQLENYNENENQERIGDAIVETSSSGEGYTSWNGNDSSFYSNKCPFITRSGWPGGKENSGPFSFAYASGFCDITTSFRAILIVN